jgi:hypothetical protein
MLNDVLLLLKKHKDRLLKEKMEREAWASLFFIFDFFYVHDISFR